MTASVEFEPSNERSPGSPPQKGRSPRTTIPSTGKNHRRAHRAGVQPPPGSGLARSRKEDRRTATDKESDAARSDPYVAPPKIPRITTSLVQTASSNWPKGYGSD